MHEKLESDEPVIGAQTATLSPSVIEVFGDLGLDFVWVDLEHIGPSAMDSNRIESLVRCAQTSNISLLVRPPSPDPHVIRKVLDTGVHNIILPRISSAAEVRRSIAAAHFTYDGEPGHRGSSVARSNGWGARPDDFAATEDDAVVIGAMIENVEAVDTIEEILSVPELGFIRIGYGDLSISVGEPFETDHPTVERLVAQIEDAALKHDVTLSSKANDHTTYQAKLEAGYQHFTIGNDLTALRDIFDERLRNVRGDSKDG